MDFTKFNLTIFSFFFWVSAYSQTFNDTIVEYEYDTVYLLADTVRITNTIEKIEKPSANPKKSTAISKFIKQNFSGAILAKKHFLGKQTFLSRITPDYLSFGVAPFTNLSGEALKLPNSYTSEFVINICYYLLWNYTFGRIVLSVGPGFTRYHDKEQKLISNFTSNYHTTNTYSYDSLLITTKVTSNLYYNYLNFYTFIGYKLMFGKKISLSLSGGGITDFLLSYSQGNPNNLTSSKIRKYSINASLYTVLTYKPTRNLELFISPFYQRLLAINDKYPFTNVQKTGIGLGFNLVLK